MDDIKLIIEVEKYRELYDPQHMLYKDNTKKDKCWDAVADNVGATSKYMLFYYLVNGSPKCSAFLIFPKLYHTDYTAEAPLFALPQCHYHFVRKNVFT